MKFKKLEFENAEGFELAARIDLPESQNPTAYALFAHCFTCTKNIKAAHYISLAMTDAGLAVMRFDFTGLGDSEGDFSDTNFSSNVDDLVAAARFLGRSTRRPCYDRTFPWRGSCHKSILGAAVGQGGCFDCCTSGSGSRQARIRPDPPRQFKRPAWLRSNWSDADLRSKNNFSTIFNLPIYKQPCINSTARC